MSDVLYIIMADMNEQLCIEHLNFARYHHHHHLYWRCDKLQS